jgi:predicted transposase YbfD/YdcC
LEKILDTNHEPAVIKAFSHISDPRKNINIKHNLRDILVSAAMAVIAGSDDWDDVVSFTESKLNWLRQFLEFPHGVPSHDTYRRVFMMINFEEFQRAFADWVKGLIAVTGKDTIALDGKTSRRSFDKKLYKKALHMVSAWSSRRGLVIAQVKTSEKSNEITALPELLKLIDIENAIVTADAMACQKNIIEKIVDKKADYVIGLKKNQKTLHNEAEQLFDSIDLDKIPAYHEEETSEHGRIQKRSNYLLAIPGYVNQKYTWSKCNSFGLVISERLENEEIKTERRYYITSLSEEVKEFAKAVREHWQVENNLHWALDISFREDSCRKRAGQSAENFSLLRRLALNMLKSEKTLKKSIKGKRYKASMDNEYLLKVLFAGSQT